MIVCVMIEDNEFGDYKVVLGLWLINDNEMFYFKNEGIFCVLEKLLEVVGKFLLRKSLCINILRKILVKWFVGCLVDLNLIVFACG